MRICLDYYTYKFYMWLLVSVAAIYRFNFFKKVFFSNIWISVWFIRSKYVVWCTRGSGRWASEKRGKNNECGEGKKEKDLYSGCKSNHFAHRFSFRLFLYYFYIFRVIIRNKNIRIPVGGGGRGGGKYLGV